MGNMDGKGCDGVMWRVIPPHSAYSRIDWTAYFIARDSGFLCLLE